MIPVRAVLCAAIIAAAPLAAFAGWIPYSHGHGHWRHARRRAEPRFIQPRYMTPSASCDMGETGEPPLRDRRGRLKRSSAAKAAFEREQPCPSTGLSRGACPGYVIDHIVALKRGGADAPCNMQWQTLEDAKAKDAVE